MIHYGEGSIARLEQERKALSEKLTYWKGLSLRAGLPALIIAIAALLGNFGVDRFWAAMAIAGIVVAGLVILIWLSIKVSGFQKRVKAVVLPLVLARVWPDSRYAPKAHLGTAEYLEADLSDSVPDEVSGRDLMEGDWAGTHVRISQVTATETVIKPTKDGVETTTNTLFSGLLLAAEIGGYLRIARLQRRSKGPSFSFPNWMGSQSPEPSIATEQGRPDVLESHYVQIPSSAELDEDLFQPDLEQALIDLTKHFKGGIHYQLNQRRLLIAVEHESIDIKIDTSQPLHQQPSVDEEAQQLDALLKVVVATKLSLFD